MAQRLEALGAGLGPAHRATHPAGQPSQQALLGTGTGLSAETAAHIGDDHPNLRRVQTQRTGNGPLSGVGPLSARPASQAPVLAPRGGGHSALNGTGVDLGVDDAVGDHHLALAEVHLSDGGQGDGHVGFSVVEQFGAVGGGLGIYYRRQRVVIGPHCLGGIGGLLHGFGHYRGDGLAYEAHLAGGQQRAGHGGVTRHRRPRCQI